MELLREVGPAILRPRNVRHDYTDQENNLRRPRAAKQSVEDRLLLFLMFLASGQETKHLADAFGWSYTSVNDDIKHVLQACYDILGYEINWPAEEVFSVKL